MDDEHLVGTLGLFGDLFFFAASLLVVIGGAGDPMVTATGGGAGSQLELAAFVADQARPSERVVLIFGDQVPGQHRQLWAVATTAVWKPRRALIRSKNARNGPGARLADHAASTSTPRTWARPALLIRPCTGAELPD